MTLGVFAKTFPRPTVEQVFEAVKQQGLRCVQFNFTCAGLPTLAESYPIRLLRRIRAAADARGIAIAAVSGTFNMIHPDARVRRGGIARLGRLARACYQMGVPVITLCTGTRDPNDMWRHNPANDLPAAWKDLENSMRLAIRATQRYGRVLAIEPETGNVVNSAFKARRLLDTFKNPRLKIVMDPANILRPDDMGHQKEILSQVFAMLGGDIALAHAKEIPPEGQTGQFAPGNGALDWDHYLALLRGVKFAGPLIVHNVSEADVLPSAIFLRGKIAAATGQSVQGTTPTPTS